MATQTEAMVVEAAGAPFKWTPILLDAPGKHEVLVKIKACSICATDLHAASGHLPSTFPALFGHEGSGIVEQVGAGVTRVKKGDSVLLSFSSCGDCKGCNKTGPQHCRAWFPSNFGRLRPNGEVTSASLPGDGTRIAGTFFGQSALARHALVTEQSCVVVPPETDLIALSSLGCGIQTGSGAVMNVLKPTSTSTICVFGLGAVGCSAVMAAAYLKLAKIIVVDLVPSRLELAKSLGATDAVLGSGDVVSDIIALTEGDGVDFVVEATGVMPVIETAFKCLAPYGKMAQVGDPGPRHAPISVQGLITGGKTYVGVLEGDSNPSVYIPQLVEMHKQGDLPLEKISQVFHVRDFDQAAKGMRDGSVIKPIIVFD